MLHMKRKYWLVIPAMMSTIFAHAQEESGFFDASRTFHGGLILGMNAAQVDGDTYGGYRKVGINAGGVVYANFSPEWGMSVELLYSQKGAKGISSEQSNIGSYFMKYTIGLNYVELPVMLHFYRTPRIHIGAGASYNQLISSKEYIDDLNATINFDSNEYPFKKFNVDGLVSVSYVLYKGLLANVRFQYSLTTIREAYNAPMGITSRARQVNNMFAFRLAYLFK
jgi:hypothetical protein